MIVVTPILLIIQEYVDTQIIMTTIAVGTGFFAVIASFITWRVDRSRLTNLEIENIGMRAEIKENKEAAEMGFKELGIKIDGSHASLADKVDELKMYLLHSKITLKEEIVRKQRKPKN